jgi:hypothetical protein
MRHSHDRRRVNLEVEARVAVPHVGGTSNNLASDDGTQARA